MGTLNVDAINDAAGSITALDVTKEIGIWQFVSTAAITAVGNLSITGLAAGYDYQVQLDGFAPTTDANSIFIRFGTGAGPTYLSGGSDYAWYANYVTSGANDVADSEIQVGQASQWGNDAGNTCMLECLIVNPGNGSENTSMLVEGLYDSVAATPALVHTDGAGGYIAAVTAVTAIQFGWQTDYGTDTFKAQGDITVWRRRRS
jgi:hypothetical protein